VSPIHIYIFSFSQRGSDKFEEIKKKKKREQMTNKKKIKREKEQMKKKRRIKEDVVLSDGWL
jgi:hypothetical protein